MKILFISGSPRREGNTANIINTLSSRLNKLADIETSYLSDYQLQGCLGCSKCQENLEEMACVQNDDVAKLLSQLIAADIILYGTPLYGHSYSGQLKLLMDRHVAMFKFISGKNESVNEMEIHSLIKDKPVALLVSCQGPEKDNTELIKDQFDKFCQSSLATCFGKYIFPWCDPSTKDSQYSEDTLEEIIADIIQIVNTGN